MSRGLFRRSVQPYTNLPFVFAIWAVQKSMPTEQRDELRGIIQNSLARVEGDYALVG
jgi:predicted solute-binding protein